MILYMPFTSIHKMQDSLTYIYAHQHERLADLYKYLEARHSREEIKHLFGFYIDDVREVIN